VVAVATAQEALERIRSGEVFRYCFVDWMMPEMDGQQFLEALVAWSAKSGLSLPERVVVSAYDSEGFLQTAKRLGVRRVLTKPVLPEYLRTLFKREGQGDNAAEASGPAEDVRIDGMRILLVEDNRVNQLLAIKMLEARGAHVQVASDGQQALDILERVGPMHFHVVLMDLQMPVMDGYTATQRLRADARFDDMPIIAMTAHAMVEEQQRCAALGMNEHITKPIDPQRLYATLRQFFLQRAAVIPV